MNNVADYLRHTRKAKNISQEELARSCDTTQNMISKYESGNTYPKLPIFFKLVKVLELDTDVIAKIIEH